MNYIELPPDADKPHLLPFFYNNNSDIHLAIPTNILCVDDRLEPKYLKIKNANLIDFTATLYLGKITFKKNKQGNLAPIYTPSQITKLSFDNLNEFWLNEKNPKPKLPFKFMIKSKEHWEIGIMYDIDLKAHEYQKIYYYKSKDNITLTKEQIISYFTELHSKNVEFIKNYIDEINKNNGIKAFVLNQKIYNKLLKLGILKENMIERYNDGEIIETRDLKLITLDYLSKTPNFKILLYDELFYAYLVWSLREFLVPYFSGKFCDENDLLFNAGAYEKYIDKYNVNIFNNPNPYRYDKKEFENVFYIDYFYANILPTKYGVGYIEGYEPFFDYHGYNINKHIPKDFPKSKGYKFSSPNQIRKAGWVNDLDKDPPIFKPSPLNKYYFSLQDARDTYIEFYQRIYPSLNNPPKGWTKEMMQKLELKLE